LIIFLLLLVPIVYSLNDPQERLDLDEDLFEGEINDDQEGLELTGATADLSAGTTVDKTQERTIMSEVEHLDTETDTSLDNGVDVTVHKDGSLEAASAESISAEENEFSDVVDISIDDELITASSVSSYSYQSSFTTKLLEDFSYNKKERKITVNKGFSLHFEKPYPITFDVVGPSIFIVDNNGSLLYWDVNFPDDHSYT
tara:strand:- start:351 stop:950 length:600 start_codon:yes stop_codon:yes gene_type:complete